MRPVLAHHKCPTHTSFPFYSVLSGNRTTISPPLKRLSRQSLFFHHNHKLQASLILQISKCIYEFFTTHYQVNPLEEKKTTSFSQKSHEFHLSPSWLLYTRACMQPSQFDFGKWNIKVLILSGKSSSFCVHRMNNSSNPFLSIS
jgi:hypothetical protein